MNGQETLLPVMPMTIGNGPMINDREFDLLKNLIFKTCGIDMKPHKKGLLQNRLGKRIRSGSFQSFKDYLKFIQNDTSGKEIVHFINAVSTNVTHFFRENKHFEFIKTRVIPELEVKNRKERFKKIRVWSAACSSGEEPYTIAMTFMEELNDLGLYDFKILGSDICTEALEKAEKGIYKEEKLKPIPKLLRLKYFNRKQMDGDCHYQIKGQVKNHVMLARINLMKEEFPFQNPIDLIFCRNVMIYFSKETQEKLIEKFYRHLAPGGYLFLGHSEGLTRVNHNFKYVMPSVYQKSPSELNKDV